MDFWRLAPSRLAVASLSPPFGPSPRRTFQLRGRTPAGFCAATTASADFSVRLRAVALAGPRSPQVRVVAFTARSPDLRRLPLVARASRSLARSPWTTTPRIRFLFIDPRLRYRFFQRRPHGRTDSRRLLRLAVRLGPCDQVPRGLPPPSHDSCWAHQQKGPALQAGPNVVLRDIFAVVRRAPEAPRVPLPEDLLPVEFASGPMASGG